MRPRRAHVIVGSMGILAVLLAVAHILSRTQEISVDLGAASESSPGASSAVQRIEQRAASEPEQSAQESLAQPTSSSSLSASAEPQNPILLPQIPDDPLTSLFATESKDPSWSDLTEAQILDEVSRLSGLSLVSIDVECRATLCRVESVLPVKDAMAWQRIVGVASTLGLDAPLPLVAVHDASRTVVLLAYFDRSKTPITQFLP
jgi:hypothetical protein